MPINTVIREKRKEIGLTQEQVAEYLGVTAPAVNKWEKGASCPDIALLPALARLLRTDLNTLLGFREGLSQQEIGYFSKEIVKIIEKDGFAPGFEASMKKIREYPDCAGLIYSAAMLLDGALMMSGMDAAEKAGYEAQIGGLYERAAASDDSRIQSGAAYMLASRFIRQENYERAREMLDRIPERSAPDKRKLEADLLIKQGKTEEAAVLLERKLLTELGEIQILLISLTDFAAREGQVETAESLAGLSQKFVRLFELWDYSAYVAPLEAALEQRKIPESLDALKKALDALLVPWDMHRTLLFRHLPVKEQMPARFGAKVLPGLLAELENGSRYDFLRGSPEFRHLLAQYREKLRVFEQEAAK